MRTDRAFTGRCNLFADKAGVLVVDRERIDAMNRIDEAVTFATLPAYKPVVEGEMIGDGEDHSVRGCGRGRSWRR